jgi:hypothetical protein
MYVHISTFTEKNLKQISIEKATLMRTLINCTQEIQMKKRGQESYCLEPSLLV